jgi:hypothetical protein
VFLSVGRGVSVSTAGRAGQLSGGTAVLTESAVAAAAAAHRGGSGSRRAAIEPGVFPRRAVPWCAAPAAHATHDIGNHHHTHADAGRAR